MAAKASFLDRGGEVATWQPRALGARAAASTNWPAVTWGSSSIRIYVEHVSSTIKRTPAGDVTEERLKVWTTASIAQDDLITYKGDDYLVETEPEADTESRFRGATEYVTATLVKES